MSLGLREFESLTAHYGTHQQEMLPFGTRCQNAAGRNAGYTQERDAKRLSLYPAATPIALPRDTWMPLEGQGNGKDYIGYD